MAFTYDPTQLSGSSLYQIRLLIGDTIDRGAKSLDDNEILHALSQQPNLGRAAASSARLWASRFVTDVDTDNGVLSIEAAERFKALNKLANRLERTPNPFSGRKTALVAPFGGGISQAVKKQLEENLDLVEPTFTQERHKHPANEDPAGPGVVGGSSPPAIIYLGGIQTLEPYTEADILSLASPVNVASLDGYFDAIVSPSGPGGSGAWLLAAYPDTFAGGAVFKLGDFSTGVTEVQSGLEISASGVSVLYTIARVDYKVEAPGGIRFQRLEA